MKSNKKKAQSVAYLFRLSLFGDVNHEGHLA